MTNILTITKHQDQYGLLSYSLDGDIAEQYEAFEGLKVDTFPVGEFSFKADTIEKSAKGYQDNYDNVTIIRQTIINA